MVRMVVCTSPCYHVLFMGGFSENISSPAPTDTWVNKFHQAGPAPKVGSGFMLSVDRAAAAAEACCGQAPLSAPHGLH